MSLLDNLDNEIAQKYLADIFSSQLDNMIFRSLFGNDKTNNTATGIYWKSSKEENFYNPKPEKFNPNKPGYVTYTKEVVVDYSIPASHLEIEGEYTVKD